VGGDAADAVAYKSKRLYAANYKSRRLSYSNSERTSNKSLDIQALIQTALQVVGTLDRGCRYTR
jgi:hypothetical protein